MRTVHIFGLGLMMAATFTISSCNGDLLECSTIEHAETAQNVPVKMSVMLTPFDVSYSVNTRSTTLNWKDGDVIYLLFTASDGSATKGIAQYQSGNWKVSFDKPLKRDASTACKAYYFDGESTSEASSVDIEPTTGVYADLSASYYYPTGGDLSITCNLMPQTSRIRFKGTAGTSFSLSGLSSCASLTLSSATLSRSQSATTVMIESDGYSPYIYGNFANTSSPQLVVTQDGNIYTADCKGLGLLTTGESGYMTLPTDEKHNGWTMEDRYMTFTANGVSFKMILVAPGTFQMGKSADNNDVTPVHSVTISQKFYIGETEVTQALWKAVTGYSPTSDGSSWSSSYGLGDNYPAYYISYSDVQSFITKLNAATGQAFRMPTEAEWEYAAKGGNKSKGYTYSGSDTIGDVAWYTDNSSSKTHAVATKHPNELGIYDMSGNVCEWCQDWYGSYSSSAQTNPQGPSSGSLRVLRGGSWDLNAGGFCRSAYRGNNDPTHRYYALGLRLAL